MPSNEWMAWPCRTCKHPRSSHFKFEEECWHGRNYRILKEDEMPSVDRKPCDCTGYWPEEGGPER